MKLNELLMQLERYAIVKIKLFDVLKDFPIIYEGMAITFPTEKWNKYYLNNQGENISVFENVICIYVKEIVNNE